MGKKASCHQEASIYFSIHVCLAEIEREMTKPRPILPRALFTRSSAGAFQRPSGRAGLALALAKNRILGQRSIY